MTLYYMAYFAIALSVLVSLAAMILKIGHALGDCPDTGRVAKAAAVTITTGFVTIGAGGVTLVAAAMLALIPDTGNPFLVAVGLACVALGLGFTHAVATLREVVRRTSPNRAPQAATA